MGDCMVTKQKENKVFQRAPTMEGNFFNRKECLDNLKTNLELTKEGKPPVFKQLFLETINKCNLKCPMCYTAAAGLKGTAKNTLDEWKEAIVVGKRQGIEVVGVAGRGEPLLDENFFKLGELVRMEGLGFLVFTNGTLVDHKTAERLKEICTGVVVKLFALTPGIHNYLVGENGAHQKAMEALRNLLRLGMRAPNLGIDNVIVRRNLGELEGLLRFCRKNNIIPFF